MGYILPCPDGRAFAYAPADRAASLICICKVFYDPNRVQEGSALELTGTLGKEGGPAAGQRGTLTQTQKSQKIVTGMAENLLQLALPFFLFPMV